MSSNPEYGGLFPVGADPYQAVETYYDAHADKEWRRLLATNTARVELDATLYHLAATLPPPVAEVADIGCGPGRYAVGLAKKNYTLSLADLSPSSLNRATEELSRAGTMQNLQRLAQADLRAGIPFPDAAFDGVLATGGVLSHMFTQEDRQHAADELARIARPGAPILVSVMSRPGEIQCRMAKDPTFMPYLDHLMETGMWPQEAPIWAPVYFYNPGELASLLSRAGLTVEKVFPLQGATTALRFQIDSLDPQEYEEWLKQVLRWQQTEQFFGTSSHFMAIARKPLPLQ